jgi:hypothetical protein
LSSRLAIQTCRFALEAILALGCAGCAFKVVRTPPLFIRTSGTGAVKVVNYPARILVHDDQAFWDMHQVKNNIVGVFNTEIIHLVDVGLDAVIPGPDRSPLESGVDAIKNGWAQLPDWAPMRIIGGFFSALRIEQTTLFGGVFIPATGDPITIFVLTRVIYLTDWIQDTLGEVNTGLGYLVPWPGPFVPVFLTGPVNDVVDWCQTAVITGYVWVFRQINIGVDYALYGGEYAWGDFVSNFIEDGEPVFQAPSDSAPASVPDKP